jgi:hypothetical protein
MSEKEYTTVKLDIPRLSDFEIKESVNYGLSITDELNKLIIKDSNEIYIRELLNRINNAIEYVNNHIHQETFTGYMDSYELKKLLSLLKGDKE